MQMQLEFLNQLHLSTYKLLLKYQKYHTSSVTSHILCNVCILIRYLRTVLVNGESFVLISNRLSIMVNFLVLIMNLKSRVSINALRVCHDYKIYALMLITPVSSLRSSGLRFSQIKI